MKAGRKVLSFFLAMALVFGTFAAALVPGQAATDLSNQLTGGLSVIFTINQEAMQTNVFSLDPSSSVTYYVKIINRSTRDATITAMNNTSYLSGGSPVNTVVPSDGSIVRAINKSALGTTDGKLLDFSVAYTLDSTYSSDGNTLARFVQPAYIGIWNTSDDAKVCHPDANSGFGGFTIYRSKKLAGQDGLNVATTFKTEKGILEVVSLSNDRSQDVTFEYNYWIDTTDMSAKTWEAAGFRMDITKWVGQRHHLQPEGDGNCGTTSLGGNYGSNDASFMLCDLVNNYGDALNYPADSRPWVKLNGTNPNTIVWSGQTSKKYATLWDSGDVAVICAVGNLFTGSTTSAEPALLQFNRMLWKNPNDTRGDQRGYFTGTVNCYFYDKTTLQSYVSAMGGMTDFAPMSTRFNSTAWSNYETALSNAMSVLANYKTTQYDVTTAYNNLVAAVSALQNNANLANQLCSVTHRLHTGDKVSSASSEVRYILAPLGEYTVPYLDSYKTSSGINKCTSPITTNYTTSNTGLNTAGTYDYWKIDFTDANTAIAAADAITGKVWCYSDSYVQSVASAASAVKAFDQTVYSATPEKQADVDTAVSALLSLTNAEADDLNHTHVAGGWQIVTEADCETEGSRIKTCTYCGKTLETETIPATGHSFSSWTVTVTPNCVETGEMQRTCQNAGCSVTETSVLPVDSTNHKGPSELRNASTATCGKAGYTGDTYCTACNGLVTKGSVIPATGAHNYVVITDVASDCKYAGYKLSECTECGKQLREDYAKDPTNHGSYSSHVVDKKDATCTEDGYTGDVYCDGCGQLKTSGEVIPAKGHTGGAWIVDVEATCGADGSKHLVCFVCGEIIATEGIPATGLHTEVIDAAVPATCTATGLTEGKHCSVCGTVLVAQTVTDMLAHTPPADWDEIVDPKCGSDGYKAKHCVVCGTEIEREVIPTTGTHTMEYVDGSRVASTCLTKGTETWKCKTCTYSEIRYLDLDPDNHESDETVLLRAKEATCAEKGYTGDVCHKCCEAVITAGTEIPVSDDHSWVEVTRVPATCVATGYVEYKCSVCDAEDIKTLAVDSAAHGSNTELRGLVEVSCTQNGYTGDLWCLDCNTMIRSGNVVVSTGHEPGNTVIFREPTCTETGLKDIYCKYCNALYKSEEIPATGHTIVIDPAVAPTCTETGLTSGTHCSKCGVVLTPQTEIAATGHTPGDWSIVIPPDCGHEGQREKRCLTCGELLESEIVPSSGEHHYSVVQEVDSTCKTAGYRLYQCSGCLNEIREALSLDPENHEGPEEMVGVKEVTCGADGYTGDRVCTACGTVLETGIVVPATGLHTYDNIRFVQPATAKQDGIKRYTCTGCGDYYDVTVVWTPHTHHGGDTNKTCTERAQCEECGEPYGAYGNGNHTGLVKTPALAATCDEAGHGEGVYCEACRKYVVEPEVIPALGHTDADEDEVCDVCGAEIPEEMNSGAFRCTMCDNWEANKDKPGVGWIYTFFHAIVHFLQSIGVKK